MPMPRVGTRVISMTPLLISSTSPPSCLPPCRRRFSRVKGLLLWMPRESLLTFQSPTSLPVVASLRTNSAACAEREPMANRMAAERGFNMTSAPYWRCLSTDESFQPWRYTRNMPIARQVTDPASVSQPPQKPPDARLKFGLDRSLLIAFSEVLWFAWCLRVWHRRHGESEFAGGARRGMARADS